MKRQELKRIVREYCGSLKAQLEESIKHFEADWDGRHIRALAGMICDDQHECIKAARKEIRGADKWVLWYATGRQ